MRNKITDPQKVFLKRLLNEAFAHRYTHRFCLDPHHLERITKDEASEAIGSLRAAKQRNWKPF